MSTEPITNNEVKEVSQQNTPKQPKKETKKEQLKFLVKTPKGTRDYFPKTMNARETAIQTITRCFRRHGAVTIDTPVFELKDILTSKYGEEGGKLIYDLADQGEGEKLSMRYDLTVPFARYLATNGVKKIKRYQIGKVYRRDQPYMTRGRQREFCQCDFDIAGEYDPMIPDAEIVSILNEVLTDLEIGTFRIKINHRKLLDAIFVLAGVPREKFPAIFSAVDKLDKVSWEDVEKEMVEVKGLDRAVAQKVGEYVKMHDKPKVMYQKLVDMKLGETAKDAMNDMKLLIEYCDALGCLDNVEFDMSLVRGLDYYTGVIFEAVMVVGNTSVGSIAGGGRYDNLVGIFGANKIPCVGFSVGLERIMIILEEKLSKSSKLYEAQTEVFVASVDKNRLINRLQYLNRLWEVGIYAETLQRVNPKIKQELRDADEIGCRFAVIFGGSELEEKKVVLKNLITQKQLTIDDDKLIPALVYRLTHKDTYLTEDPEMFATEEEVKQFKQVRHQLNVFN
ncbi:histidine--tRNA ligase, putative [Entamoeba histolytica HM-1:IMSS-B]|uniref:histidine--tRNA ligase n=6 Tax=Entamoeba histolytica TaxID=5759 RepID=C4M653_ENTH1|nr:histidyl-tRNA synthetase, putative [Entamoeba histolytica HM-1:IMSS]EMD43581.1 histidyl-tRNA synthetase, putative [Entamoeba histolytica KU27]EMH73575.1 histidine--tRNA ligase, putative [Entamoeba histolytica HM-1:IMSS-B]EMS17641.1 histidyl-tRNA synthetase, cytoplasmic, putative [Entamoeba histolytica HM-3:IMSS]ENY65404.1 histidyl-tRNA synthetase, cytoplasmic, putative [Entamoeba histolytica HM-1:IMSS-A]GAT96934.1 histidyl-tRNA synthetase putative [Entamoeba histolytica]|eukprot:XP_655565.1 histidyl-tRNA synthetase, putative [Entamoeba histolytica HM-1:IMSS]